MCPHPAKLSPFMILVVAAAAGRSPVGGVCTASHQPAPTAAQAQRAARRDVGLPGRVVRAHGTVAQVRHHPQTHPILLPLPKTLHAPSTTPTPTHQLMRFEHYRRNCHTQWLQLCLAKLLSSFVCLRLSIASLVSTMFFRPFSLPLFLSDLTFFYPPAPLLAFALEGGPTD